MKKYLSTLFIFVFIISNTIIVSAAPFNRHLEIAIEEANKITIEELESLVPIVYEEFVNSIDNANCVFANSSNQEEIDLAFDRLANAMHMLSFKRPDKTNLINLIEQGYGLFEGDYEAQSWQVFNNALDEAIRVNDDENALEDEVNITSQNLITAINSLKLKPAPVVDLPKNEEIVTTIPKPSENSGTTNSTPPTTNNSTNNSTKTPNPTPQSKPVTNTNSNSNNTKETNSQKTTNSKNYSQSTSSTTAQKISTDSNTSKIVSSSEETTPNNLTEIKKSEATSLNTPNNSDKLKVSENNTSIKYKNSILYTYKSNTLSFDKTLNRNIEYMINPILITNRLCTILDQDQVYL